MAAPPSNSDFLKAWVYGLRPLSKRGLSFDPKTIPSLAGKVILVTGGASGIGRASVRELARHDPAVVWIADRDAKLAAEAVAAVKEELPAADVRFLELDLGSAASVAAAATTFLEQSARLDVLMLNAGVLAAKPWATADGFEAMFGVNFVGHARLAALLLPRLIETAALAGAAPRLVAVSSGGHGMHPKPEGIRFGALADATCRDMHMFERYGQSKLAVLLWVRRIARLHPQITAVSIHPGNVATTISAGFNVKQQSATVNRLSRVRSPEQGALNQLWAATAPNVVSGKYYCPVGIPDRELGIAATKAADKLEEELWQWLQGILQQEGSAAKETDAENAANTGQVDNVQVA